MMKLDEIKSEALQIARAKLGNDVKDAIVKEDVDSEGRPSLRVTIILKSQWSVDPPGSALNEISRRLTSYLSSNGDERFPYTHYMTTREFTALHAKPGSTARRRQAAS
jgi:hypothetical protein